MSKGIDISIDALVADFTAALWTSNVRGFYGRVFRNERNDKISPEIWVTPNNYIEVLKDTGKDAQCFFDVQPSIPMIADVCTAEVWLCMMVNLAKLYPTLTRQDATEQAHEDVKNAVMQSQFDIKGLVTGITGFSGYDWGDSSGSDMSPHYLFRYNLQITYSNN